MIWLSLTAALLLNLSSDPFTNASRITQIPTELLVAISSVESNHHSWALNINGKGIYPKTREEAERILDTVSDNVDIGLMQINYRIWGKPLGLTKTQLMDPYINVWAGAWILRYYFSRHSFWEAVGRYHSGDEIRKISYTWKVYRALSRKSIF